jgi:hypothetical protein
LTLTANDIYKSKKTQALMLHCIIYIGALHQRPKGLTISACCLFMKLRSFWHNQPADSQAQGLSPNSAQNLGLTKTINTNAKDLTGRGVRGFASSFMSAAKLIPH